MRITDLLDRRSISLTGTPKTKSEALDQIIDLIGAGVDGIHLYTMNNPDVAARILDNLSHILG